MKNEVGGEREDEEENKLNLSTSIQSASWIKMSTNENVAFSNPSGEQPSYQKKKLFLTFKGVKQDLAPS